MTPPRLLTVCGSLQARSANRAALDVVSRIAATAGADVDEAIELREVPALDPDREDESHPALDRWRQRVAAADAIVVAAPEYAGGVAGLVKNAFDWLVGSGGIYRVPMAVISAGTSGGEHARRQLVQTLTWQGGWVVAELGVVAPRTKSDAAGQLTDPATLDALGALTNRLLAAVGADGATTVARARQLVTTFGIAPDRVAPA